MVEQKEEVLTVILKAVSDTTRRAILTALIQQGPTRVTDLADYYAMSLNAVSKHIKVLENAGLVSRTTQGRVHLIEASLNPVNEIEYWLGGLKSIWALRLEALEKRIVKGKTND